MGILTDKIDATGVQILEWQSQILDYKNRIYFLKEQLNRQLENMKINSEFTQEDCDELIELINSL